MAAFSVCKQTAASLLWKSRSNSVLHSFRRWQTTQHTLAVKKKIEETRDKAIEAGGKRRIDTQHKKVIWQVSYYLHEVSNSFGALTMRFFIYQIININKENG